MTGPESIHIAQEPREAGQIPQRLLKIGQLEAIAFRIPGSHIEYDRKESLAYLVVNGRETGDYAAVSAFDKPERLPNGLTPEQDAAMDRLADILADHIKGAVK